MGHVWYLVHLTSAFPSSTRRSVSTSSGYLGSSDRHRERVRRTARLSHSAACSPPSRFNSKIEFDRGLGSACSTESPNGIAAICLSTARLRSRVESDTSRNLRRLSTRRCPMTERNGIEILPRGRAGHIGSENGGEREDV